MDEPELNVFYGRFENDDSAGVLAIARDGADASALVAVTGETRKVRMWCQWRSRMLMAVCRVDLGDYERVECRRAEEWVTLLGRRFWYSW